MPMAVPRDHAMRLAPPRFTMSVAADRVLRLLSRYRIATCPQLCRAAGYSPRSLTYIQAIMKQLTLHGYCLRPYYPRRRPTGSSPAVYTLGRKGLAYLQREGVAVPARYRPSEEQHSPFFYDHTIAVVDVLVAIDRYCQADPSVMVYSLQTERDLKRQAIAITDTDGRVHRIVNDAFIELRVQQRYQMCLALEVDRGSEEQKAWRAKVAHLLAYASGPFQQAYGTDALTIVVTTPTEKRRDLLRRWTEATLRQLQQERQADLFRITSASPIMTSPVDLFTRSLWYRPFAPAPLPLLPQGEAAR